MSAWYELDFFIQDFRWDRFGLVALNKILGNSEYGFRWNMSLISGVMYVSELLAVIMILGGICIYFLL